MSCGNQCTDCGCEDTIVAYATKDDLKEHDIAIVDSGFDCMQPGSEHVVMKDNKSRLYLECSDGIHLLDGQLDGGFYIGIRKKNN